MKNEIYRFYYQNHKHLHAAKTTTGEKTDTCADCGKDIRNPIHLAAQNQKLSGKLTDVQAKAKKRRDKLQKAAEPLMKLLCEEYHPHHTVILTGTSIELNEGVCSIPKIYNFVVD